VKIYLATWLFEISQGESLTKVGNTNRLLSYYHTKEKEAEFKPYCENGVNENISSWKRSDAKGSKKGIV